LGTPKEEVLIEPDRDGGLADDRETADVLNLLLLFSFLFEYFLLAEFPIEKGMGIQKNDG